VPLLVVALLLSTLGSLAGALVASGLFLFDGRVRDRLVSWLVSYAVGTLLGLALLGLVPEALEALPAGQVLGSLVAGILTFFILEKLLLWRHSHELAHTSSHASAASLVIVGDAFHTFVDGAIISAAVLTSPALGVTTAIAAAAHELPQELGDLAILLGAGFSKRRAFILNLASGATGMLGALAVYFALGPIPTVLPYVLSFSAGSFLYVAMADLIPSLHRGHVAVHPVAQVLLIATGLATVVLLERLTH
jgi:zinc and cadmium transporter